MPATDKRFGSMFFELLKCLAVSFAISTPLSLFGYFASFGIAHASEGMLVFFEVIYAPAFFILDYVHGSGKSGSNEVLLLMFVAQWLYFLLALLLWRIGRRLFRALRISQR